MNDGWTKQEKLLLAVVCGVVFLDTLDLSLVQVALPSIGSALHLAAGQLQWVVSAFVLGYGWGSRPADGTGGTAPRPAPKLKDQRDQNRLMQGPQARSAALAPSPRPQDRRRRRGPGPAGRGSRREAR